MTTKTLAALGATLLIALAGCGSDDSTDEGGEPAARAAKATPATPKAAGPSYATVKKLALAEPATAKLCAKGAVEDRRIGAPKAGEQYTRMVCGTSEILEYVSGKDQFSRNHSAAVEHALYPVWSDGTTYVKTGTVAGGKTLAARIEKSCGCGTVEKGGFGS